MRAPRGFCVVDVGFHPIPLGPFWISSLPFGFRTMELFRCVHATWQKMVTGTARKMSCELLIQCQRIDQDPSVANKHTATLAWQSVKYLG